MTTSSDCVARLTQLTPGVDSTLTVNVKSAVPTPAIRTASQDTKSGKTAYYIGGIVLRVTGMNGRPQAPGRGRLQVPGRGRPCTAENAADTRPSFCPQAIPICCRWSTVTITPTTRIIVLIAVAVLLGLGGFLLLDSGIRTLATRLRRLITRDDSVAHHAAARRLGPLWRPITSAAARRPERHDAAPPARARAPLPQGRRRGALRAGSRRRGRASSRWRVKARTPPTPASSLSTSGARRQPRASHSAFQAHSTRQC